MLDPTSKIKNLCIAIEALHRVPDAGRHLHILDTLLKETITLECDDIAKETQRRIQIGEYTQAVVPNDDIPF